LKLASYEAVSSGFFALYQGRLRDKQIRAGCISGMKEPNAVSLELLVSIRQYYREQQVVAEPCILPSEEVVAQNAMLSPDTKSQTSSPITLDRLAQQASTF
jgi:hypothetical protein